jgi:hypothetical protein
MPGTLNLKGAKGGNLQRGALVEYKGDMLGPISNVVIFQFNPESLSRTIRIPTRSQGTGSSTREVRQGGDEVYESISLTAHFSAADQLNVADSTTLKHGVGPQLAALEKMAYPLQHKDEQDTEPVDAVGETVSSGKEPANQPTPRRKYPNVLFVWGEKKILPVVIDSMTITEKQFDANLNPIQAEVSLGLSVIPINRYMDDRVARGAAQFSRLARDEQVEPNVNRNAIQPNIDLISI